MILHSTIRFICVVEKRDDLTRLLRRRGAYAIEKNPSSLMPCLWENSDQTVVSLLREYHNAYFLEIGTAPLRDCVLDCRIYVAVMLVLSRITLYCDAGPLRKSPSRPLHPHCRDANISRHGLIHYDTMPLRGMSFDNSISVFMMLVPASVVI